jgi:hypothetical protein
MTNIPEFDVVAAHKYFSADCFNRAWDLMDKKDRSVEEDRTMVLLNQASLYHWSQRPDNDNKSMSIGYWQASRIQSLLGNAAESKRYARICLEYSRELEPFYLGYAYEALARAARASGDTAQFEKYISEALKQAQLVSRQEDRELLLKDLAGLN